MTEKNNTYAGFWRRFSANILDFVIIFFMLFDLIGSIASIMHSNICAYVGYDKDALQHFLFKFEPFGLYVTDDKGERISFGRATARHFSKIISNFILLLGYCLAGWTSKKQALHDMISGCLVLKR